LHESKNLLLNSLTRISIWPAHLIPITRTLSCEIYSEQVGKCTIIPLTSWFWKVSTLPCTCWLQ